MGYLRVRPPTTPRDAEVARIAQQQRAEGARTAELLRIAARPGGRELLTAALLAECEREVRERLATTTDELERRWLTANADDLRRLANEQTERAKGVQKMDKARVLRKEFRDDYAVLAQKYKASQDDRYLQEYRDREGAAIRHEMSMLEATLSRDMLLWHYGQQVEAERLRHIDPTGDAATETRRLREQLEITSLAERFPTEVQASNFLFPQATQCLAAGNVDRARVLFEAARKVGAYDGELERDLTNALDLRDPNRRKATEIVVAAADELELSRRDIARMKLVHEIGTRTDLARASTTVKLADYRRQREDEMLLRESGIELPPAD